MSERRKTTSLVLAVSGALAMVIVCLIASVLLLKLPFIAKHLPSVELAEGETGLPEVIQPIEKPEPAPIAAATLPGPDCAQLGEILTFRLEGARGCIDDLQCGLSVPRQRCMISVSVGLRAPLEDAILAHSAQCNQPLTALDSLCRTPDREWQPVCERNQCVLREVDSPW